MKTTGKQMSIQHRVKIHAGFANKSVFRNLKAKSSYTIEMHVRQWLEALYALNTDRQDNHDKAVVSGKFFLPLEKTNLSGTKSRKKWSAA